MFAQVLHIVFCCALLLGFGVKLVIQLPHLKGADRVATAVVAVCMLWTVVGVCYAVSCCYRPF